MLSETWRFEVDELGSNNGACKLSKEKWQRKGPGLKWVDTRVLAPYREGLDQSR